MKLRILLSVLLWLAFVFAAHAQSGASQPGDTPATNAAAPPTSAPMSTSDLIRAAAGDYSRGDLDAAQKSYEAVLQQDSKSIAAYAGLTRVYLKQEKIHEAEEMAFKRAEFAADRPLIETARG